MTDESGRTLGLLRHAKSAWPDGVADHYRPLAERGERDSLVAGRVLVERMGVPSLALVSTAERAQQTWRLLAKALPHQPRVEVDERVYDASAEDLLLLLREVGDRHPSVLVVGHNPGMELLALGLNDDADGEPAMTMASKFPTCALAVLDVRVPWAHLAHRSATLRSFDVARG